ncbi:uncharacterized protein LOC143172237 [Aptenodytes patagonicus]|uniref:uncharacterized protein LOC143172237 n=1 Tax=Aptenodytes patagonicus TaxID=9234 RepID=UPI003FA0472E
MRPLIKTETVDGGQGGAQQVTTRIVPYSPTDLVKIQEKYSRGPRETETEYVWRVSLTGGDCILLSEDEARGYWGLGVFITTNDNREPWSLTQRVAYWAGGLDPMERGDPFSIKMPTAGHILESVQKTACLQLMHDRLLVPQQPSPMQHVADPDRLHPLIRGLPDALKLYAVQLQDRLRALRPQRRGGPPEMTWGEVAQELINYERRMGFTGLGETKSKADLRRVERNGGIKAMPSRNPRPTLGYCHSPTIAHYALAQELARVTPEKGVRMYQYIDDILIGGPDTSVVGQTQMKIITHLESLELQIPTEKVQLPSSEGRYT